MDKDCDIFLSYSTLDQRKLDKVASALEGLGWRVWWQKKIPGGVSWRQQIEERCDKCGCIVVLISSKSRDNRYVMDEVNIGITRDRLIPLLIEPNIRPPLGTGSFNYIELFDWDGSPHAPVFSRVIKSISNMIGQPSRQSPKDDVSEGETGDTADEITAESVSEEVSTPLPETASREVSDANHAVKDPALNQSEDSTWFEPSLGLAGRLAQGFINFPLTPHLLVITLLLGMVALTLTPREADPSASRLAIDVFATLPGNSTGSILERVTKPLELALSEMPALKHIHSTTWHESTRISLYFSHDENRNTAVSRVNQILANLMPSLPPGTTRPEVRALSNEDTASVSVTLWSTSPDVDEPQLQKTAMALLYELKRIPQTGRAHIIGGRSDRVLIEALPDRLEEFQINLDRLSASLEAALSGAGTATSARPNSYTYLHPGIRSSDDLAGLVVGNRDGTPVKLEDLATLSHETWSPEGLVHHYLSSSEGPGVDSSGFAAVTVVLTKKPGANGPAMSAAVLEKVEALGKGPEGMIADGVEFEITQNDGRAAQHRVNMLLWKLALAVVAVFFLLLIAFGALRPALSVSLVFPVAFLLTFFYIYARGYSINPISIVVMVLMVGILADDAIVIVENIYRRWMEAGRTTPAITIDAVREVGNPIILATLIVIAALVPVSVTGGPLGVYLSPLAELGSVAVLASLFACLIIIPWWSLRLRPTGLHAFIRAEHREHQTREQLGRFFHRLLPAIISSRRERTIYRVLLWIGFAAALAAIWPAGCVPINLMPPADTNTLKVVIDMPQGASLAETRELSRRIGMQLVKELPEIRSAQAYIGIAAPLDLNGVHRRDDLRQSPRQAEIRVLLLQQSQRAASSHEITATVRKLIQDETGSLGPYVKATQARVAVLTSRAGPPSDHTALVEIYGSDAAMRQQLATDMIRFFERAGSITPLEDSLTAPADYRLFSADANKVTAANVSLAAIERTVEMALAKHRVGELVREPGESPLPILLKLQPDPGDSNQFQNLAVPSATGAAVPLSELGSFGSAQAEPAIHRKDFRAIDYVAGEGTGRTAAPVYGIREVERMLSESSRYAHFNNSNGYLTNAQKDTASNGGKIGYSWNGQWVADYKALVALGVALTISLLCIYFLLVWEFADIRIAAIVMTPIPLSFLGIIPGHWLFGEDFTVMSVLTILLLSVILVRFATLIVEFVIQGAAVGMDIEQAVIEACSARARPIIITMLAIIAGAAVLLADDTFRGMAASMIGGSLVATVLTFLVVPLNCVRAKKSLLSGVGRFDLEQEDRIRLSAEFEALDNSDPYRMKAGHVIKASLLSGLLFITYFFKAVFHLIWNWLRKGRQ